jgi:hypothetical protein
MKHFYQLTEKYEKNRLHCVERSQDSPVSIATVYMLDGPVSIPGMARSFSSPQRSNRPPMQWVTETISPGVNRPGREADHSPPSSAEVNNGGAIPPFPYRSSCHSA